MERALIARKIIGVQHCKQQSLFDSQYMVKDLDLQFRPKLSQGSRTVDMILARRTHMNREPTGGAD